MSIQNRDPQAVRSGSSGIETAVSTYDRYNAALIASILVFGFVVALMLAWYFTRGSESVVVIDPPPPVVTIGDGKDEPIDDDVLDPGAEDMPDVEKPLLMTALEQATEIASSVPGVLRNQTGPAALTSSGWEGRGTPPGDPDPFPPGTPPEHKRWQIQYECENIDAYARQLDFFEITLGLVDLNTKEILLVTNVSTNPQSLVSNRREQSNVLRFEHRREQMRRWDRTLAGRADVELRDDHVIVQFFPEPTREIIRTVEAEFLTQTGHKPDEIRKTVFAVRPVDSAGSSAFEFRVSNMVFGD